MNACLCCGGDVGDGEHCPECRGEVDRWLETLGRVTFNRALELIRRGHARAAEESLCAACALLPNSVAPRRALGKLRAQRGQWLEARDDLALAQELAPADTRTTAALAAVERRLQVERWRFNAVLVALLAATLGALVLLRYAT